jgi:hypothetical protein
LAATPLDGINVSAFECWMPLPKKSLYYPWSACTAAIL